MIANNIYFFDKYSTKEVKNLGSEIRLLEEYLHDSSTKMRAATNKMQDIVEAMDALPHYQRVDYLDILSKIVGNIPMWQRNYWERIIRW